MLFEARVKSVLSGDTIVLSHVTNPTQERILSLAYVSAPRLRREGDEVGVWLLSNWGVWQMFETLDALLHAIPNF